MVFSNVSLTVHAIESAGEDTPDQTINVSEEDFSEEANDTVVESSSDYSVEETIEEPVQESTTISAQAEETTLSFATLDDLKTFVTENLSKLGGAVSFGESNTNTITVNANGLILLSHVNNSFEGITIRLNGLSGSQANLTSGFDIEEYGKISFEGLGRAGTPFKGTITSATEGDSSINVILDRPLFNAIDVSCAKLEVITNVIIATAVDSIIGFADCIEGSESTNWPNITIELKALLTQDGENKTYTYPGSCIGTMKDSASVTLGKIKYTSIEGGSFTAKVNSDSGNAGILCNTMEASSALHVAVLEVDNSNSVSITSGTASAGGLVGYMDSGASLSVGTTQKTTIGSNWLISGKYAGGIVGEAENVSLDLNVDVNQTKIRTSGSNGGAGGIVGIYKLTNITNEKVFKSFVINNVNMSVKDVFLDATDSGSYIGGLFGILNPETEFSIIGTTDSEDPATISSTAGMVNSSGQYELNGGTSYGGLVGQVLSENSDSKLATLSINGKTSVTTNLNKDITYYGGLIGVLGKPRIDDANKNGAYVVLDNLISTTCNNCDKLTSGGHYFGGAIGGMFYDSVFDISETATFSPTAKNIKYGGGIVGVTGRKSTVRLAGTTNLTDVSFAPHAVGQNPGSSDNYRNTNGQIVGVQNASIIYAAKTWELTRPTNRGEIDDIGNYGSVIRLGRNIGQGEGDANLGIDGGLSENLISQSQDPTTSHKTVFEVDVAPLNGDVISIENADQFALLSIAEQTYGDFGIYPKVTNGFIIGGNKVTKIVLNETIDLRNTGITGLQRDFYNGSNVFTGELDGNNKKITLDVGQLYANGDQTGAGNGQIHGHSQVGLFSQANATIKNLTIEGTINIRERILSNNEKTSMAVGAAVALSTGSGSTFENVTTNIKIKCKGAGTESCIGGLLGLKQGTEGSVSISNCIGNAQISDTTTAGVHVVGGLIGAFTGDGTINVSNSRLTGSITNTATPTILDAKYGGLVSVISVTKGKNVAMYLINLTVDGQKIENGATTSSGGLLGYEWNNTKVYFGDSNSSRVVVQGESAVTVNGDAEVGGLVYRATGYWQVNDLELNRVNIQNQNGDLGLMICYGRKEYSPNSDDGTQLLYVEETKHDAYHIDANNVTVSSAGGYFDEWVVYTAESAETIIDNGNSVISIATEEVDGIRKGFDPTDSTSTGYQNRTTNNGTDWPIANPNARYYYDLDDIREKAKKTNGYVDTSGETVLWSVWRYCEKVPNGKGSLVTSNIQEYLKTADIASETFDGHGATINLTGYSYYPVTIDAASVEIKNCTFVFANKIINNAEEKTGDGFDSMKRKTTGTASDHTQHYMMHTGLIWNYKNTSTSEASVTLSVNNVTLQGTIGKSTDNNGSGAIVCGTVEGTGVGGNHVANVKLHTVTMDNLQVNTDLSTESYAPLLINTIGSYGGIDAQQIYTKYDKSKKAATSLIGHVGNATATNISLAFSNVINLNGKTEESIFTHASLLESFQYLSSSSGYYHFNEKEICTYGKEINGTIENVDEKNVSKQLYYFDTGSEIQDGVNKNFNTVTYLPYVYQTKVMHPDKADTFHELEINIVKPDLDEGCGTYDDPYIISQAEQLTLVAQYIAGIKTAGWKVNIVKNAKIIESESNDNHTLYVFGNEQWSKSESSDDTKKNETEVRDYLRNAYYKISADLILNNFSGLGTMENPFRGVVDGGDQQITVNAEKITSGFINVSYGSVVQNLNITYTGTKTLSNTQAALNSNAVANKSYFGGIIGDVKGGDNLINNVSVSFDGNFKIVVQNHLQCVGGFFGIVEGGGVILSNMSQPIGLNNTQIDTALDEKNQAYISPLIGRVLDGFVINETTTSGTSFEATAGSDKNYSIGNVLNTASLDISVSDNFVTVNINKEEELLLLSAMINSGACSAGYSLSYKNVGDTNAYKADSGKVRNADYSQIGNPENLETNIFKTQYFEPAQKDDTKSPNSFNLSYLITNYMDEGSKLWDLCSSTSGVVPTNSLNLNISKNLDMSGYKNGYRGIGGRYNCTSSSTDKKNDSNSSNTVGQFQRNTPVFSAVNGNNNTLTVDNQINGYSDDNYVANAAGGLINILRRKVNTVVTIQNLTVTGNVELHDFSDTLLPAATNASGRSYASSVGGVIGRYFTEETSEKNDTYLFLTNLSANDLTLYSDGATGGIVGQTGTKKFFIFRPAEKQYASGVTYTDCSYSNLTAMSCQSTGGIVGAACDNADSYYYNGVSNDTEVTNRIVASRENVKTGYDSTLSVYASSVSGNGLGGLIGNVGSNVEINKDGAYPLVLDQITLQDKIIQGVSRTGGAIGLLHHGTTKAYNITVSNSTLGNGKDDNLGGIVGCWLSSESGGVMEDIIIDHCSMKSLYSAGGLVGYIQGGNKIVRNVAVKYTDMTQITHNSESRGVALVAGEIVGGGITGENVLLRGNTISTQPKVLKGRIIGKTADLPIQLLGVSVQYGNDKNGNTIDVASQPKNDIGSFSYSDYPKKTNKILISYDAFLTKKTAGSELDKWPNVSIPGVGIVETVETNTTYKITGDTVNPYTITGSDTFTGIVNKEGNDYKYIGASKTYQNVNTANVDKLIPGIVSTYNANQDTRIEHDFNVVQIDGSASCLKQYLNAATNGAFDTGVANGMAKVEISRYKWNSEKNLFEDVTNQAVTKRTLAYDAATGDFYATAQYDNQKNMFTLVTVTFKTTSNNYSRTYHIPVVVRRMLQVDVMATMVSGTVFNSSEMINYNTHALASAGEDITGYLTFKYNSNLSGIDATYDWQNYMEAGANLLGYYKKTMDTGSTSLPSGTKITIIDCQHDQRQYHATVTEETLNAANQKVYLELFGEGYLSYKDSSDNLFDPVTLSELLEIEATNYKDDTVKWVQLGTKLEDSERATVKATNGFYYRLYDDKIDSEISDLYTLTVGNPSPEENYYVVISIPQQESHMLTLIKDGGTPKGSMTWSDPNSSAPPTEIHQIHRYTNSNGNYERVDTNKSSEISFNYLNNYEQRLEDIISEPTSVSVNREDELLTMQFDVVNEVSFDANNYEKSDPLYQEFRVSLNKTIGQKQTEMFFPSDASALIDLYTYYKDGENKVYFKIGGNGVLVKDDSEEPVASYEWTAGTDGNMVLPFATLNEGVYHYLDLSPVRQASNNKFYIEVKARNGVTIGMSSVVGNELLPSRDGESTNQTTLHFISHLSFKKNGLSYSTLRGTAEGKIGYYFAEKRQAVLELDYLNVDQLGINVSDTYTGEIDTMVTLDFSESEGFSSNLSEFATLNEADKVVFTFSLNQKGSVSDKQSVQYNDVNIETYINRITITGQEEVLMPSLTLTKSDGTYPYYNETIGVFSIPITFKVNTELPDLLYSNYRIYVTATAYKNENPVEMSVNTEKAFITYTLAKINTNGYWETPASTQPSN